MREKRRGAEQADKTSNGKRKEAHRRNNKNTRSNNGEGTTDNNRRGSETKKQRAGSWDVRGLATEERKMIEIAGQVKQARPTVDIQSWEFTSRGRKRGGGDRMRSWRLRMDREKEEGTKQQE